MADCIESQGVSLQRGDGGGPEVFTSIGRVSDFSGPQGSAAVIDCTTLEDTAKVKLMGLPDEGQFSFTINLDPGNAQHIGLKDDRAARTKRNFQLILTDVATTTLSFAAFVVGFAVAGTVDDKVTTACTMEISGAVTWS